MDGFTRYLNQLGSAGNELVSVWQQGSMVHAILKRPIE